MPTRNCTTPRAHPYRSLLAPILLSHSLARHPVRFSRFFHRPSVSLTLSLPTRPSRSRRPTHESGAPSHPPPLESPHRSHPPPGNNPLGSRGERRAAGEPRWDGNDSGSHEHSPRLRARCRILRILSCPLPFFLGSRALIFLLYRTIISDRCLREHQRRSTILLEKARLERSLD